MKSHCIVLVALSLAVLAAKGDDADLQKELAALEGEWTMVSGERDGLPLPPDQITDVKRISMDGETSIVADGQVHVRARYTIDPSKKTKTIDHAQLEGPNKGKTQLGIYELNGDTVKFCFGGPSQERPTDFKTTEGSGKSISVWKRIKK